MAVLVPHALKPARSNARIAAGMLGIAVTEPVLDEAEVLTFVCEGVAAGVTQHVRVDLSEPGAPPGGGDHVIDRASHHLTATLGDEEPRQLVFAHR
jgi:hypothetical protein